MLNKLSFYSQKKKKKKKSETSLREGNFPDTQKKENVVSVEFYPISRDWGELGILNLAQISLLHCY